MDLRHVTFLVVLVVLALPQSGCVTIAGWPYVWRMDEVPVAGPGVREARVFRESDTDYVIEVTWDDDVVSHRERWSWHEGTLTRVGSDVVLLRGATRLPVVEGPRPPHEGLWASQDEGLVILERGEEVGRIEWPLRGTTGGRTLYAWTVPFRLIATSILVAIDVVLIPWYIVLIPLGGYRLH